MKNHITKDLSMEACTLDDALCFKHIFGKLSELCAPYIDDCCKLEMRHIENYARKQKKQFQRVVNGKILILQKFK